MKFYNSLKKLPNNQNLKKGDLLVLFGELFDRGYANGLVQEALNRGVTVISGVAGRRDKDQVLRPLNEDELSSKKVKTINVPLEAGFDLEEVSDVCPVDLIKELKLSAWEDAQIDFSILEAAKEKSRERFKNQTRLFLSELDPYLKNSNKVLFAHLMAGGVPRTKIVLPLMNRALKGTGDRFLSSERFWHHPIGQFCKMNFHEVTANTFKVLIEETAAIRESKGITNVGYLAYGYHGTEILIDNKYQWQTYTPYLQGWAKKDLEMVSTHYKKNNINTTVYNCPEILTNSSAIFNGVEVSLYPLLFAIERESSLANESKKIKAQEYLNQCFSLLKESVNLDTIKEKTNSYFNMKIIKEHCQFEVWPQHNSIQQLEFMLNSSEDLFNLHLDPKNQLTPKLSQIIVEESGRLMIDDIFDSKEPVTWLNHDILIQSWLQHL